jgi:YVTN family beta-propeller protein
MSLSTRWGVGFVCLFAGFFASSAQGQAVVNYESPHVHPIDLSPNGQLLAVCNTMDNRVELFDVTSVTPQPLGSVAVGYDPVSVRFRSNTELWAVNLISDTVSVIDVPARNVKATIQTLDEPCDVVFAGEPLRAFVSCSQVNTIQVFDPSNLAAAASAVVLDAEDPRALAVSPDGTKVYAAIYESGNKTTILMGSSLEDGTITFPLNVTDDGDTPHGGMTPHFNGAGVFVPAKNAGNGTPPKASLIVRQGADGKWRDNEGADWTEWVSGSKAGQSSRPVGWTLLDHDVAVIDANTLSVGYIDGLMNINMAIGVEPTSGAVTVVGTEAHNEIRFEPNVNGIFVRSHLALTNPATLSVGRHRRPER